MATTAEIKGLFSKEHIAIVLMVVGSYVMNYQTYKQGQTILLQQAEIKASIKILTYRLDEQAKKKLAISNAFGQKWKNQHQASLNVGSSFVCHATNINTSGYRLYQTDGNSDRYSYHVCGS
jgi:hypothetical protein